jgi:hypothetical protein
MFSLVQLVALVPLVPRKMKRDGLKSYDRSTLQPGDKTSPQSNILSLTLCLVFVSSNQKIHCKEIGDFLGQFIFTNKHTR